MTSAPPPQPPQFPGHRVAQVIRPLRDLAAYALVAAPALWLFVAVIRLIPSEVGQDFLTRVQNSFYGFVNLELLVLPLAAVLLATVVQPVHKHAKLITIVALIEYVVAAFFAIVFGFLIALVKLADFSARAAFEEFLVRATWLVVFGVAAYMVFRIWRNLFFTPKPKAQPGMYGQPQQWQQQYGQPGYPQPQPGQPGQPGFPPPPGHPGYPQPGYPQPGQYQPGQWGQPPADQGWGAPLAGQQMASPPGPPVSAQPASSGAPGTPPGPFAPTPGHQQATGSYSQQSYPPPAPGQPEQPGGHPDATRAIPHHEDEDRTRVVGEEPPPRP